MRKRNEASWRSPPCGRALAGLAGVVGLLGCTAVPVEQEDKPQQPEEVSDEPAVSAQQRVVDARVEVEFQRAIALMHEGQFRQAADVLESVVNPGRHFPGLLLNLGIAYSELGEYAEAEKAFRKALEEKPGDPVAHNQLGILHRKAGRFQQAREAYERALEVRPDYALAHLNLGILCDVYLHRFDCAMRHYQAYQRLSADEDPAVALWIKDLERQRKSHEAETSGEL